MGTHFGASVLPPLSVSVSPIQGKTNALRLLQHPRCHLSCGFTGRLRGIPGDYGNHSCVSDGDDVGAERRTQAASGRGVRIAVRGKPVSYTHLRAHETPEHL